MSATVGSSFAWLKGMMNRSRRDCIFIDDMIRLKRSTTETYISIRRLENRIITSILNCEKGAIDGQIAMVGSIVPIKVEISQFYGIEINDFAVTVSKTALWITESQMLFFCGQIVWIGEL